MAKRYVQGRFSSSGYGPSAMASIEEHAEDLNGYKTSGSGAVDARIYC